MIANLRFRRTMVLSASLAFCGVLGSAAETIDPNQDGSQYSWAENVGWLNAEPSGDGGPGAHVLLSRAEGWIWSENVGWISLSCRNTGTCQTTDYGVTHDGAGILAGLAWSENAGWISFSCSNTASCQTVEYGVRIDLDTGEFSGWAWSENLGWLSFSCANTTSCGAVDYVVQTDPALISTLIFTDGFESGDTSAWSDTL